MENDHTPAETLRWLGVLKALKGFSGQLAVVAFFIALIEVVYSSLSVPTMSIDLPAQQVIIVVIGMLFGIITYAAGNFWDRAVFNRLYGLSGTRIDKPATSFFPSGSDLKHYRGKAIESIQPAGSDGIGIYRDSKNIVETHPDVWKTVEEPIVLSKIARSFIWPAVLTAFMCPVTYIVAAKIGWEGQRPFTFNHWVDISVSRGNVVYPIFGV